MKSLFGFHFLRQYPFPVGLHSDPDTPRHLLLTLRSLPVLLRPQGSGVLRGLWALDLARPGHGSAELEGAATDAHQPQVWCHTLLGGDALVSSLQSLGNTGGPCWQWVGGAWGALGGQVEGTRCQVGPPRSFWGITALTYRNSGPSISEPGITH